MSVSFTGVFPRPVRIPPYLSLVRNEDPNELRIPIVHTFVVIPPLYGDEVLFDSYDRVLQACSHDIDVFIHSMGEFSFFQRHRVVKVSYPKEHAMVSASRILVEGTYTTTLSPKHTLAEIEEDCLSNTFQLQTLLENESWTFLTSFHWACLTKDQRALGWLQPQYTNNSLTILPPAVSV